MGKRLFRGTRGARLLGGTAVAAFALAATPAGAVTTVLDFAGNICGVPGNEGCGNGTRIGQNYGDSAIQDVSYRSFLAATDVTVEDYLKHWGVGYGDLPHVVWGGADAVNYGSEMIFTALAGYEVSLIGFDAGCYQNRANCRTFPYTYSVAGGPSGSGSASPPAGGRDSVLLNTAYGSSIVLRWGPDGYDGGLSNIAFDVRAVSVDGAVPEPATWATMIAGFGLVGGALRRRRGAAPAIA